MRLDDILTRYIGEMGRFQMIVVMVIGIEEFFIGFQIMAPLFIAADPGSTRCRVPEYMTNDTAFRNCSWEQQAALTSPVKDASTDLDSAPNGTSEASRIDHCLRYGGLNGSSFPDSFLAEVCREDVGDDPEEMPRSRLWDDKDVSVEPCLEWEYGADQPSTIVTEWDLVCDRAWKAKVMASVYLGGRALGNFIFGWLADRFGRRKVILGAGLANVVCGVVAAFSPTLTFLLVVRFFHGMFATGKANTGFVLAMEYSGPSKRAAAGCYVFVWWALGYMGLAGLAYFIRNWRWLQLAVSLPELVYYTLFFFLVPESPRWLYVQKRRDEGDKILRRMAKVNKRVLPVDISVSTTVSVGKSSPLDLVRLPGIRSVTFILIFVWATCGFVYYGLSFASPGLEVNLYVSCVIGGAVEIPAYLAYWFIANRTGRLWPFSGSMFLAGLTLLVTLIIPSDAKWTLLAVSMLGKFFMTVAFTLVWIYSGEVYPTCIRNIGVTVTATAARVSSPLAPYVALLAVYHPATPALLFTTLSLMAGVLILRLPETRGQTMMQTLDDGEAFVQANRLTFWKKWRILPRKQVGQHGAEAAMMKTAA